jgi:cytidine deaminase
MTQRLAATLRRALARQDEIPPEQLFRHPDWLSLWQMREHIVLRAIAAATKRGRSWRNFQVGAAAFVSSSDPALLYSLGRTPRVIYTGSNWKIGEDERNTCAEQEIVAQLRQQEHHFPSREILALVVAGEPRVEPDAESGLITNMLPPCHHCRKLLMNTPQMKRSTLIIMVNLSNTVQEVFTFQEVLKMHGLTFPPPRRSPS